MIYQRKYRDINISRNSRDLNERGRTYKMELVIAGIKIRWEIEKMKEFVAELKDKYGITIH